MGEPFRTQITVRTYELDALGHLNHAVYHAYAEVARVEAFDAAGGRDQLHEEKKGSVVLAATISYRREVRYGETVEITTQAKFGSGKTFQIEHKIYKPDGTLSAELMVTMGLMDLARRKLVEDPRGQFERAGCNMSILTGE